MIPDVGKNTCSMLGPDDGMYIFYNAPLQSPQTTTYFSPDGRTPVYTMSFTPEESAKQYRCLHYTRAYANGATDTDSRIVPYLNTALASSFSSNVPMAETKVQPLYEVISPSASSFSGRPGLLLTFWTNLNTGTVNMASLGGGSYQYDSEAILKFEQDKLEDISPEDYSLKALCSVEMVWESLKTVGGMIADTRAYPVPVISRVNVVLIQKGNIAVDFASGGGGGVRRHNHMDNANCGFSYAVFAPGTSIQPINWK